MGSDEREHWFLVKGGEEQAAYKPNELDRTCGCKAGRSRMN